MRPAMADVNPTRPSRRDRARATRLRMIHAAQRVFTGHGYAGARMTDIAAAAGVAVQTVYFTFHTKAELLQACYELAVLGEDDPRPPPAQPWHTAMLGARDGRAAIRRFAEGNSAIAARVAQLDDVVRSAAHEPDAAQVRDHNEQLRRDGYRRIIEHLDGRFGLPHGLDPAHAVDILLTLGGPATYRSLVIDYRWTHDRFVDWLTTTLSQQLLAPRAGPSTGHRKEPPAPMR
jgi:AcrR family transcriptional regulator